MALASPKEGHLVGWPSAMMGYALVFDGMNKSPLIKGVFTIQIFNSLFVVFIGFIGVSDRARLIPVISIVGMIVVVVVVLLTHNC